MTDSGQVDVGATHTGHVPLRWVAVVVGVLAGLVYGAGLTASPDEAGIIYQSIAAAGIVIVPIGIIIFCVWTHRRYAGTPLLGWPGWQRLGLELLIALLALVTIYIVPTIMDLHRLFSEPFAPPQPSRFLVFTNHDVIIAPVVYCLAGFTVWPVAEEMLYRGVLYGSLRRWMRPIFAVVLQAAIFGVMHRYGLVYMTTAFVAGLLFMGLYLWRRILWSPILTHALVNATGTISLLVALLAASGDTVLGIAMEGTSDQMGCRVNMVVPDSAAEDAGLNVGDVIIAVDNQAIETGADVAGVVGNHRPGDTIHLTLVREGRTMEVPVELRARRPHVLW